MTSNFSFSSPVVEKLLLLVQANPVLYNTFDTNYKNISLKDSIWKDISFKTEKSVDDIKQTWENIRDSHSRIIAKKPERGSAFNIKKNWILVYRLNFLNPDDQYLTSNAAITEIHDPNKLHKEEGPSDISNKTKDGSTETTINNLRISKFKQIEKNALGTSNKLSTQDQKIQIENEQFSTDEVVIQLNVDMDMDMFFQKLTLKAKQFPTTGRIEVKMKICTLMNELQEKYLVHKPSVYPRMMQPIHLFIENHVHIPSEQNYFSSSSSIQSCATTLPSLHSGSEYSNSESSDDSNLSI